MMMMMMNDMEIIKVIGPERYGNYSSSGPFSVPWEYRVVVIMCQEFPYKQVSV